MDIQALIDNRIIVVVNVRMPDGKYKWRLLRLHREFVGFSFYIHLRELCLYNVEVIPNIIWINSRGENKIHDERVTAVMIIKRKKKSSSK